jgi:thiamine-phosphate pyrophosphorylase
MIDGGAKLIQLRSKDTPALDFFEDAKKAVELAHLHDARIIINDRVDVALAVKADGVHLGQTDLPPVEARKVLGTNAIIGYSTHSADQAADARSHAVDYIAIGPVFPTATKENPDSVVGLDGVRDARKVVENFPLVAIGGITLGSASEVIAAGADSVAVIGELVSRGDEISSRLEKMTRECLSGLK